MAYIRKVRTGSGATAVQIVEKERGRLRMLEHMGSAHDDLQLATLMETARAKLRQTQPVLDLGIDEPVRTERVLDASTGSPEPLFEAQAPRELVPGPRVLATTSDLLYAVLRSAWQHLGLDTLGDPVFEQLVLARIVEPTSKLDAPRVLRSLGQDGPRHSTIYRHLRKAQREHYRSTVAEACFGHAATSGDLSLVLYDVTTLYFEAENEDESRKVGYSKERRVDPQIVVGLLVDRNGFPLEIGFFEGNHAETRTIVPLIEQFQARHSVADMAVVADAGMLSATNLAELNQAHLRFIVGSRQTKAPGDLAHHFGWHGDAFTDGQTVDTLTPRRGKGTGQGSRPQRAEPVWDPGRHQNSWRAIWQYRTKRAVRDQKTLTQQENRARAVIAGQKQVKGARFVKTTGAGRSLDEASLARARSLVGLKGYVTNIPAHVMPVAEVISSYHDLWRIEQSFRMSKTDLRARPVFHRTREAIEAHLTIVFAALAVSRYLQAATGLSIKRIIQILRPLQSATLQINGTTQTVPPVIGDHAQRIIDAVTTESGH